MRFSRILVVLAGTAILSTGCAENASNGNSETPSADAATNSDDDPADIGIVLAVVEGIEIGSKEFQRAAAGKTPENGSSLSEAEKVEVLEKLINDKILYLEAKNEGVDKDPKVQKVMINTLLRDKVYTSVKNADFNTEELQAYFQEHHDEFVVPPKAQVKRIFLRINKDRTKTEALKQAADIRAQLIGDSSKFKELAMEHSEDPYKRRGGDLGFLSKEGKPGIDPIIVEKAFSLEAGAISDVFEAGGGVNIITVPNKRESVERTFEQMRGSVLRKVKNDRYKSLFDNYVEGVRTGKSVTSHLDLLKDVTITAARPAGMDGMPSMGGPRPGNTKSPQIGAPKIKGKATSGKAPSKAK